MPDLIREISQENVQRSFRPRRSNTSSTTSFNSSPKKKRHRNVSREDEEDDDSNDEHQRIKKRIRRIESNENSFDAMSAFKKKTRDRLARKALDIDANPHENTSYKRF